jgi:hypothetical protein
MKKILLSLLLVLIITLPAIAGQDIKFVWDPYTADTINGFNLYMAGAPGVTITPVNLVATIPLQNTTAYTQKNVPAGIHYWILTAFTVGQESGPSNEVSYMVKLKPPSGLGSTVVLSFGNVTVTVAAK